jgi:MFS transporter, UMF1 family
MNPVSGDTASPAPQPAHVVTKRAVTGWVMYDLANTIFAMGVTSLFFPFYVRDLYGAERADTVFTIITAISMGLIFIASPMLGAMTDRAPKRMPFLVASTLICILLTTTLGRFGFLLSAICYILANIAYQAGTQFYDAMLPEVSNESNRGRIGGIGVGIGYLGSYIAVGASLYFGTGDKPFLFVLTALLFLLFSLPCILFVKERGNPDPRPIDLEMIRKSTGETIRALKDSSRFPGLGRFLIGRVFYTDPINTVLTVMSLFTVNVAIASGLDKEAGEKKAQLILMFAITLAILGGFFWGWLTDKIGPKKTLNMVLCLWLGNFILGFCIGVFKLPMAAMYVLAGIAGFALGGVWSADRPYMLRLTPPDRIGEFYGLYGMVGRFSAITGPGIWALSTWFCIHVMNLDPLAGQGISMLFLLAMMIVGFVILQKVDDKPRDWEALSRA